MAKFFRRSKVLVWRRVHADCSCGGEYEARQQVPFVPFQVNHITQKGDKIRNVCSECGEEKWMSHAYPYDRADEN